MAAGLLHGGAAMDWEHRYSTFKQDKRLSQGMPLGRLHHAGHRPVSRRFGRHPASLFRPRLDGRAPPAAIPLGTDDMLIRSQIVRTKAPAARRGAKGAR